MMSMWVDFKTLRERIDLAAVLKHYGVELKRKGRGQAQGYCPLPNHRVRNAGEKPRSPSFAVSFVKGAFHCFSCHAHGNVLDFVAYMEGLDPSNGGNIRKAALLLQEWFPEGNASPQRSMRGNRMKEPQRVSAKPAVNRGGGDAPTKQLSVVVNQPLDFALKDLDTGHPYLHDRGFTPETVNCFGIGFCNRGMLKGRIAIPIHNESGALVAYAGRLTDDRLVSDTSPKYLFPAARQRNGNVYEFRKSLVLYNAHRIEQPVEHLFVVEGFPAAWWLWQAKLTNVVAVMGSSCSEAQGRLIVERIKPGGEVWVVPDGDDAGRQCAHSTFEQVASQRFVRWVQLEPGKQPTDLAVKELLVLLEP